MGEAWSKSIPIRVVSRLDVKNGRLVKGIQLEGLRDVGDPVLAATEYYLAGLDELVIVDVGASLYGGTPLPELVRHISEQVRIPVTVGGGVRDVKAARTLLGAGADRIALNSAAVTRPSLIKELAEEIGTQAVVLSVHAKERKHGSWECLTESGRQLTGVHVTDWIQDATDLGAGEVFLTSVDRDGTKRGFDTSLVRAVREVASVPVIASGGFNDAGSVVQLLTEADCDGFAVSSRLHFGECELRDLKETLARAGIVVRQVPDAS